MCVLWHFPMANLVCWECPSVGNLHRAGCAMLFGPKKVVSMLPCPVVVVG